VSEPTPDGQEYKRVSRWFIFFMLRTKRGLDQMDRIGRWRVSPPIAWILTIIMPVAAALSLYVIGFEVVALYFSPQSPAIVSTIRTISPLANFLLPGLNPYLPLSVWLALIVAVVIHEASHGIVARSLGLRIKSAGVLLLAFLPIGAFVEVDDKQLKEVKSRDSIRVLAAGSGINVVVGVVCVLLLILTVGAMTPAAKGAAIVGVVPDSASLHSPAYVAGIQPGDFVTALNGSPITDLGVLHNGSFAVGEKVNVTVWRDGRTLTFDNVALSNYTETIYNTANNQTSTVTYPFLGVEEASYQTLQSTASGYASMWKGSPLGYLVDIPTFPRAESQVPFSDQLAGFYSSPLGSATPAVASALYWMFFVNFSLGIFNCLPIYPLDGGQAFESFLRGAPGGRISDLLARRVTTGLTLLLFLVLFAMIAGPYITGVFSPS